MSYLILKHLTGSELAEWANHLPAEQTFSVSIVLENAVYQPTTRTVNENKNSYRYLRQWDGNFFDPS